METNRQKVECLASEKVGSIDDKTFFTSKRATRVVADMIKGILLRYKADKKVRLTIFWGQPEDTAFTDHKEIYVNGNYKMFDGVTRKGRWLGIKGMSLHETAHILYTNQKYFLSVMDALEQGILLPRPSKEITMFDLKDKNFLLLYKNIWNILEDGYIEYRFLREFTYKLYRISLNLLRKLHLKSFPTLKEMIDNEQCEEDKVLTINNLLLCYCKYGKLLIDKKSDMQDIRVATLIDCMPYINEYNENDDIHERYRALNEIIVILEPLIAEYLQALEDNKTDTSNMMQNQNDAKSAEQGEQGAANSTQPSSATQAPSGPPSASKQKNQSQSSNSNESKEQGDDKEQAGKSGNDESESQVGKSQDEATEGDESKNESAEADTSDKQNGQDEAGKSEDENSESSNSQSQGDAGEDADSNDDASEATDNGNQKSRSEGGDLGLGDSTLEECIADGEGELTYDEIEAEIPDDIEAEMERLEEKLAEDEAEIELEDEHIRELQEFDRSIDYGEIHRNVDCKIHRVNEVSDEVKESYLSVGKEPERVGKTTSRLLKQILKDRRTGGIQKGLYFGKSLAQSSYSRHDKRYFQNKKLPTNSPTLAVALVIDESGSMCGSKISYARFMAITTYTFCKEVGADIMIMGHSTGDGADVAIYQYTDFGGCYDNADKYRLLNIQARNCNRDGYAVKYAVERIKRKSNADMKLVIVVSDGQPNNNGYQGAIAFDDLRHIKSDAKKAGIDIIAAAIDEDKEIIQDIYGSGFLNISNLKKLPQAITNTIKKYLPQQ